MTRSEDPIADRAAQLEAAWAAYATGLDEIHAERRRRITEADAAEAEAEAELYRGYWERVAEITGEQRLVIQATGREEWGPGPLAPPEPPSGAEQEAADIAESGQ